jgi:hypothetical protein
MHIAWYSLCIWFIFNNVYDPGGSSFSNICIHYPFKWIRTCLEPIDSALERDIGHSAERREAEGVFQLPPKVSFERIQMDFKTRLKPVNSILVGYSIFIKCLRAQTNSQNKNLSNLVESIYR